MKRTKTIFIISAIIIAAIMLAGCAGEDSSAPGTESSAGLSEKSGVFSDFTAKDINDNSVTQTIFAGKKLTMVNIWATFCGPCIREMPDLKELHEEYSDKNFQVVGIPVDITDRNGNIDAALLADAKEIVSKTGADYLHILPSKSLIQAKLNKVSSLPETVFVDENGSQVGKSYIGSRTKAEWAKIIDALLEQTA